MATLEAFQDGCWCLSKVLAPFVRMSTHVRGKERVFHLGGVSSHALSGCLPHSRHPSLLPDFLEERQTTAKCEVASYLFLACQNICSDLTLKLAELWAAQTSTGSDI